MHARDLSRPEPATLDTALDALDTLARRLDTGEPVRNILLGDAVDRLRRIATDEHALQADDGLFLAMDQALESLGRGEAGAAGAFVMAARRYIHLRRAPMT